MENHLGIRRGLEHGAVRLELAAQLLGIDQIAVVRDGHGAMRGGGRDGLGIAEIGAARGGVAHVADGPVAGQAPETVPAEDVGDPAHGLLHVEGVAVRGRDARRLLASML